MMGKLAVIETLAQSIYFTSYCKVLVLFFCCRSLALPTAPATSSIITGPGWPGSASPMQPSGKCRPTPNTPDSGREWHKSTGAAGFYSWIHWNCWGFTDHPSSERNSKCTVNKDDKMWRFLTWTGLPQRWNFGAAPFLGAEGFVAELHHLWNVQTVAICTDVVSVSFRVLQRAAERQLFIINTQIFIPLKFIRVLAWIHLGVCPCGSLEINLNIPNHTNCLFFPPPVKTQILGWCSLWNCVN